MGLRSASRVGIRFLSPLVLALGTANASGHGLHGPARVHRPAAAPPRALTGGCQASWSDQFGGSNGLNGSVDALCVFDDGSGPALFVAGSFTSAGGVAANGIAKWDGEQWSCMGNGVGGGSVAALRVFDDGSGPALYAAGSFLSAGSVLANRIAKWDGTNWSGLGVGLGGGNATTLAVFDDGSGPALYVGGDFSSAGGAAADELARWKGGSWSALAGGWSSGAPLLVCALAVYDDGSGPGLCAGGSLQVPGGAPTHFVARWSASGWNLLTSPYDGGNAVFALAVHDDGSGPALFAGGDFVSCAGVLANNVARWNGSSWSPLGSGTNYAWAPPVQALAVFDEGGGAALYAGGNFSLAGGVPASNIARWDGANWSALGSGTGPDLRTLSVFDDGSGAALFAGGSFANAGGLPASALAEWHLPPGCGQIGVSICEPGQNGTAACPCANPPAGSGRGCDNDSGSGGASIGASGHASLAHDTLLFTTSGENPSAMSVLMQGTAAFSGGAVFAQGVRCVTGSVKRLCMQQALAGSVSLPVPGSASVSARSAAMGDSIAAGTHRYYGVFYRDPLVQGGCPATSTYNVTQQLDVLWHP